MTALSDRKDRASSRFFEVVLLLVILSLALACSSKRRDYLVVASKNFTESMILGELMAQQIEAHSSVRVERRFYMAGTYICQQAMLSGRIDMYPEYTGTALTAILKEEPMHDAQQAYEVVKNEYARRWHFSLGPEFGFDDNFAMEIRGEMQRRLAIKTLSQAVPYAPEWRAGFGYEFMERPDGYRGLSATYGLHFKGQPRVMDLGLLARALEADQIDIAAGNTTDGLIPALDLFVLDDDKHYFPPYDAVPVIRDETLKLHPEIGPALAQLKDQISDKEMQQLNYAVDGQHREVKDVVREFLVRKELLSKTEK